MLKRAVDVESRSPASIPALFVFMSIGLNSALFVPIIDTYMDTKIQAYLNRKSCHNAALGMDQVRT